MPPKKRTKADPDASDDDFDPDAGASPKKRARGRGEMAAARSFDSEAEMILFSAMASHILGNRPALYATPGLEPWRGNGGSIINNKLQQMLVRMEKGLGGDGSRMKELTAKAKRKA